MFIFQIMIPFKVKKHDRAKYALYYPVINKWLSYEHVAGHDFSGLCLL